MESGTEPTYSSGMAPLPSGQDVAALCSGSVQCNSFEFL